MLIAISSPPKCNFLTPQLLTPEFQEELEQFFFLAAVMWYTLELAPVIRDYSGLNSFTKKGLAEARISEIWKELVTSDHFTGLWCV